MKKSKLSLLLVLSLVLSMFLAACSGGKDTGKEKDNGGTSNGKAPEQVLNVLESAEVPTMDSVMAQDVMSFTMLNATNEGLYRLDPDQKVIEGVADGKPVANADGTVYTIKLKKDQKWSNGDPVTANDFVFAWRRAIDPKTASPYGPYFMEGKIKNASDIVAKKKPATDLGIKAVDDYTLEISLEQPIPFFESYITFQLFYPQNEKYVKSQGKDYAKDASHILYNGPFKMTKWDGPQATEWVLEKNDTYWNANTVSLKKINFNVQKDGQASANAFEAGEADITPKLAQPAIIQQYEGSKNLLRYTEPSIFWLKFNEKNPALANANIRKAIALAIDKKALTDDVLANGSIPANFIVAKDFAFNNGKDFRADTGEYLKSDKAKAKELWTKGLSEIGKKEVTFNYVGQDTAAAKDTDAFIKDQLEKTLPGIKVELHNIPFATKLDREDKQQYDILFSGWGPDYADPMTYMDLWPSTSGQQHMSYKNPKVDQLVKDAATTLATKPDERWKALQEAEKIVLEDDAALAPLYQRSANLLVADKVKGLAHHGFGPDYSYQWIKIVK
ncbi:peptide ABC transporter substrate-binding protein [Bacillus salipaludis]|uniref:Peptide ABC transporter substrate-binding protein n=1 Tax=Bacillus salipaludis TaxID=2547811 RepID=A0A4R5VL74_9BACI|nr:peptide ABC transporter substrate-binding protein [Bacillus salipaludis]MDQ6596550.1 peptide ABC transporter substrate-binding protein [Bacillus salipaludis]TDK58531.1 peptide ABC transporter substrate-binding protein [Bacillus salipaludis]